MEEGNEREELLQRMHAGLPQCSAPPSRSLGAITCLQELPALLVYGVVVHEAGTLDCLRAQIKSKKLGYSINDLLPRSLWSVIHIYLN